MAQDKPTDAPIVDSHAHVYTTDMPLSATAWHKPPADATIEQYIATLDRHGVQHAVLSAASLFDDYNEYSIEATRVGKFTNYDRLVLEIWTDGTITPQLALTEAAKIYRKHLNPFVLFEPGTGSLPMAGDPSRSEFNQKNRQTDEIRKLLDRPITDLELSVRARNCLDSANLQNMLNNTGETFTLFAPTDDAFDAAPDFLIDKWTADPEGELRTILSYHVVGDSLYSDQIANDDYIPTWEGRALRVSYDETDGLFLNGETISTPDIQASNGVIHATNGVLVP